MKRTVAEVELTAKGIGLSCLNPITTLLHYTFLQLSRFRLLSVPSSLSLSLSLSRSFLSFLVSFLFTQVARVRAEIYDFHRTRGYLLWYPAVSRSLFLRVS